MKHPVTKQTLEIIRTYAYKHEMSLSEFGRRAGVSKAWLSKLQHTDANLSIETAADLLSAAGYTLKVQKGGGHPVTPEKNDKPEEKKEGKIKSRLKKVAECQNI